MKIMVRTSTAGFILLALFAAVFTACGNRKPSVNLYKQREAKSYYQQSLAFFSADKGSQALEEIQTSISIDPYRPAAYNVMGLIYYHKERFEKAERAYKKAIELDPEFSDAHHNLGTLNVYLGRYDEAINQFKEALANDVYRNIANSMNALGWVYLKKQDYIQAELAFKDVIERDRKYLIAYDNLAKVYMATNRFDDAIFQLNAVLRQSPMYPEANLDMGICLLKKEDTAKAREYFLKVVQRDPLGKMGAQAREYLNLLE